jgi:hypothetical protein
VISPEASQHKESQKMPRYEYQLLEVRAAEWDRLQESINQLAREGFRYRDVLPKSEGHVVLIFEREAKPEIDDAWSVARAAMKSPKPGSSAKGAKQEEPKYPPEDDE